MKKTALGYLLTVGFCLVSPAGAATDQPKPARPNILWLIAEDFGQHLGCYGAREVWTPNLDQLAGQGVRYTRFFTTAPVCSPSRSAFMTGMYQTTIGAHNHRSHRDDGYELPRGVRVLTDWMRDAGYFTANLRDLPPEFGFKGTAKTDWNFTYHGKPFDSARWSDLKSHQPFYAQINFQETHRAFTAPKRADPAKVELPPWTPDHPVAREDWAKYLDAATELDRKVGLVLKQLETDGLADSTVVVFFGDNGQSHVRGKQFCYDEGLLVPLIIRWPKNYSPPKHFQRGTVDSRLLESIDLAPTMLDIAGAIKPAKMEGGIFLGSHAAKPKQYVFGARDRCDETVFRFRTVRDSRYRYIRNFTPERPFLQPNEYKSRQYPVWTLLPRLHAEGKLTPVQESLCAPTMPEEELYDLQNDPYEIRNLAQSPEHQAVLIRLRGVLERWIADTHDQGRELEPPELATRKGLTKEGTNPNTGYTLDGSTNSPRAKPRHASH
jgi:N-sulfoglucosamine sulfohydrolase